MISFIALLGGVLIVIAAIGLWRLWIRPWAEVEQLVQDVANGRVPRTFVLSGNRSAQRIGISLEDLLLRQQELATRAQQDELDIRCILGAVRDGLAVVGSDGLVRLLNRAARDLFATVEERAGQELMETFRDPVVVSVVMRTLQRGQTATESINIRGSSQGEDRRVTVTSLPMQNEGGRQGAVVLFRDVTQLEQLEQVRREFVSNVSHELRTPLSIFRGYLETLLDEPDLAPAERKHILEVMEKHSTRLHSLVDDLLSLARLEAPDPRLSFAPVSLPELLSRVVKEWEKKAVAKQLHIADEIADDLPVISADEARLEEVIYNLLDNAVKYSNPGGTITVRAARRGEDKILISVSDQGAGIAAADLPRIFERFYRADKARSREFGGTGLGLAIVKHIVQLHGGSVEAESKLGHGTTVRAILPISGTAAAD